ncbi:hypothetical protein ACFC14_18525 [Microbacterium sp. NPDC055988]|uniref:hypothetical protein n=1 Tax=Microbacterium sp. NPDC055988 TaxID=3345671 RepID=UPI0035E2D44D
MVLALIDLLTPIANMPDIRPDFTAPFFKGFIMVASWILAIGLVAAFIAVVLGVTILVFKGVMSSQLRATAAAALPWAIIGLIVLSGITGIFTWLLGLDFGFGTTFGGPGH